VTRYVNTDHPGYQHGVDLANLSLDNPGALGVSTVELLRMAELAADEAHLKEDTSGYHVYRGLANTLQDYLNDQAT